MQLAASVAQSQLTASSHPEVVPPRRSSDHFVTTIGAGATKTIGFVFQMKGEPFLLWRHSPSQSFDEKPFRQRGIYV